jgi:O-antigen/teichoic acid export membrane protein
MFAKTKKLKHPRHRNESGEPSFSVKRFLNPFPLLDTIVAKSAISILDQVIVSATGFLSTVILARFCQLSELGAYHLGMSVIVILQGLQSELITAPYTLYRFRVGKDQLESYTGSILIHQAACMIGFTLLLGIVCFTSIKAYLPPALQSVMPILTAIIPLVLAREFSRQFSFSRYFFGAITLADFAVMVIQILGLYWITQTGGLSLTSTFTVIGLASICALCTWWAIAKPRVRILWNRIRPHWQKNWKFSRWVLMSHIICSTTPYYSIWIIAWLRTEAEAGKLAACVSLIGLSTMFTTAITNVMTPKMADVFAAEELAGLRRVCRKTLLLFSGILGAFCIGIFLFGDWLGTLIYGERFGDIGLICTIEAAGMLAIGYAVVAGKALLAIDRPRLNLPADVITAVVTLGMALVLIPEHGILGASLARLIGFGSNALARWAIVINVWSNFSVKRLPAPGINL